MQMRVFSGIFMAENAPIFSRTLIFTWKKKYFFLFFFRNHVNHVKFFFKKRHVREVSRSPIFGKKVLFFRHVLSTSMILGPPEINFGRIRAHKIA